MVYTKPEKNSTKDLMEVKQTLSEPESGATNCGKAAFRARSIGDMNPVEAPPKSLGTGTLVSNLDIFRE